MSVRDAAALLLSAAGIVTGVLTGLRAREPRLAMKFTLEFWTAAGLLRLSSDASWQALGLAGAVVLMRRLLSGALLWLGPRRAG